MPRCQICEAYLTPLEVANNDCPACRERQAKPADSIEWHSAARVTNLAEAGYLVSCLEAEGIDARLIESQSFSALGGSWSHSYELQVPQGHRARATEILRAEAEQFAGEGPEYDQYGEPIEEEPVHLVFWRPVALMALAGLATLWLSQRVPDARPRTLPNRDAAALGAAIEALGEPLVVTSETGQTKHRLRYFSEHRVWYLESDTNGDGRLDRRQRFALEPTVQ
jgi:hypothetical protein